MISGSPQSHCQEYFGYNSIINPNGQRIRRMRRTQFSNQKKSNSKCSLNKSSSCQKSHKIDRSHCSKCCCDNSKNFLKSNSNSISQSRSLKNILLSNQTSNNPSKIIMVNQVDKQKQKSIMYVEYNYMMEQKNQQPSKKSINNTQVDQSLRNNKIKGNNKDKQGYFNKKDIKKTFGDYYNGLSAQISSNGEIQIQNDKNQQNISLKADSRVSRQKKQIKKVQNRFSNMIQNQIHQNYQKIFQHSNQKTDSCTQTNIYSKILSPSSVFQKSDSKLSIGSKGKRKLHNAKQQKQIRQIKTQKKISKDQENIDYFGKIKQRNIYKQIEKNEKCKAFVNEQSKPLKVNQISNDASNPYKLKKNLNFIQNQKHFNGLSQKNIKPQVQEKSSSKIKLNSQCSKIIHKKMTVPNTPTPYEDYNVQLGSRYKSKRHQKSQIQRNNSFVSNTCSIISNTSRASSVSSSKSKRQQISQKSRIRLSQYSKQKNNQQKNKKISLNVFKTKNINNPPNFLSQSTEQKQIKDITSKQKLSKGYKDQKISNTIQQNKPKSILPEGKLIKIQQYQQKSSNNNQNPTIVVNQRQYSQNSSLKHNIKSSIMDSKSTQKNLPYIKKQEVQKQKQKEIEIANQNEKINNNKDNLNQEINIKSEQFPMPSIGSKIQKNNSSLIRSVKLIKIISRQKAQSQQSNTNAQKNQIQSNIKQLKKAPQIISMNSSEITSVQSSQSQIFQNNKIQSQVNLNNKNQLSPSTIKKSIINIKQKQSSVVNVINQNKNSKLYQNDKSQKKSQLVFINKQNAIQIKQQNENSHIQQKKIYQQQNGSKLQGIQTKNKGVQQNNSNSKVKIDTIKIQKIESQIQIQHQQEEQEQNKSSRNGSYDLYKPKSHHFSKLTFSSHIQKKDKKDKVDILQLSKKVARKKSNEFSSVKKKSTLTIQSGRNLIPLNQNDAQNFINYIDEHDLAISFLYLYVQNTKDLYADDQAIFQRYEKICFLMQKKHLYQKNNIIKCLKGLSKNIFTLSGLQVADLFLKKFLANNLVKDKIEVEIEQSKQLFRQFQDTYRSIRKKYPGDPLIKLETPNDNFTKQIVKLLMQQLTQATETIDHIQQNSSQMSGNTSFGAQILELQERAIQIMEIIFLLSELNGRKIKKCQLINIQNIQFDSYYQKNVDSLLSTYDYFQKLKFKDEQNQKNQKSTKTK